MTPKEPEFEEIDLRDYLEVLLRHKYMILGIFFVCVIAAAVLSFRVLPPVYRSTARVIISSPPSRTAPEFKSYEEYLSFRTFNPIVYSPEIYVQLFKSPSLEEKVIETLNLRDRIGKGFSSENLEGISSMQVASNTRIIELNIEYKDAVLARDIANTWVKLFIEENKKRKLQAYITLKNNLNRIKILDLQERIRAGEVKVKELRERLKDEVEIITLTDSIDRLPLLRWPTREPTGETPEDVQVEFEYVNPVYQLIKGELVVSQVQLAAYHLQLIQLEKEMQDLTNEAKRLNIELSGEESIQQRITQELTLAEETYNYASYQSEELKGIQFIQKEDIRIANLGKVAKNPIKPNKKQNVAIGGILGLLIGVVAAFGVEWWSRGKVEKSNEPKHP